MAANVETMFAVGATPWHGLGTVLKEGTKLSIKEGLLESGLNWDVEKQPLITVKKAQEQARKLVVKILSEHNEDVDIDELLNEIQANVDSQAITRLTDESVLGVVGARYEPLQNSKAFGFFQQFLDSGLCTLHTAGSLNNGKQVWVLAELDKEPIQIAGQNDCVSRFIMLSNSHDGKSSVRVGYTPIRIVCANTLAMAERNGQTLRIRHTRNMEITLDRVKEIMNVANASFEATAEQYQHLAKSQVVCPADLRNYVKVCLDMEQTADEDLSTRGRNIIDEVVSLCIAGKGNIDTPAEGTYWAAYNGVTEYLNHRKGRNQSSRLNSLWFGTNQSINIKALEVATLMAK